MPTPPLSDEKAREALDAFNDNGGRIYLAAQALGLNENTFKARLMTARARGMDVDPAIRDSMVAVGTGLVPALAWAKTKSAEGTSYSVLLKPPQVAPEDMAAKIRDAFEGMTPAPPVVAPEAVMSDLLTLYPLMDVHLGMHAWGAETGGHDYDLRHALQDMRHAFAKVLALTPQSDTAILVIGGDFFHADDNTAQTPQSRHNLDVDGRFLKVVFAGVSIIAETVDLLLRRHSKVIVRALRGNHDEHAHIYLTVGMAERYREDPRVEVIRDARDILMYQWGRCAIFAHHGDKAKPQQHALTLSDICPFWSATRHRHMFTGHVHHDHAKDIGPMRWESLRAFAPPDAYAASMGYGGRRAMQSVTFHKLDGLVLRALDPIDRLPERLPEREIA